MEKLKYVKSDIFNEHYYQCCNCGLDHKTSLFEMVSGINCKCGAKFTNEDIRAAKNEYIEKMENLFSGANLDLLSSGIALNVLNKAREYHGRECRENNDFVVEVTNSTKEYILNHIKYS